MQSLGGRSVAAPVPERKLCQEQEPVQNLTDQFRLALARVRHSLGGRVSHRLLGDLVRRVGHPRHRFVLCSFVIERRSQDLALNLSKCSHRTCLQQLSDRRPHSVDGGALRPSVMRCGDHAQSVTVVDDDGGGGGGEHGYASAQETAAEASPSNAQ